jgi:hypothetical protein
MTPTRKEHELKIGFIGLGIIEGGHPELVYVDSGLVRHYETLVRTQLGRSGS